MKKWLILFVSLLIVATGLIYFFVPRVQQYSYSIPVKCTQAAASRYIFNTALWPEWWPGAKTDSILYNYNGVKYRINNMIAAGIEATAAGNSDSTRGYLQVLPGGIDSCQFVWTSSFVFSANPLKRVWQLFQAKGIRQNISSMLNQSKLFFENQEYVYGVNIVKQKVADSCMVALKQTFDHNPTMEEIYGLIASVKQFIQQKKGEETKSPMLHVHQESANVYEAMVAIPTKNQIPSEGKFQLKMLVLGNILMAEVTGGAAKVAKAEKEMDNYVKDYQKMSPAIPFQSLITDRMKETDSNKWVTRLYHPIFN